MMIKSISAAQSLWKQLSLQRLLCLQQQRQQQPHSSVVPAVANHRHWWTSVVRQKMAQLNFNFLFPSSSVSNVSSTRPIIMPSSANSNDSDSGGEQQQQHYSQVSMSIDAFLDQYQDTYFSTDTNQDLLHLNVRFTVSEQHAMRQYVKQLLLLVEQVDLDCSVNCRSNNAGFEAQVAQLLKHVETLPTVLESTMAKTPANTQQPKMVMSLWQQQKQEKQEAANLFHVGDGLAGGATHPQQALIAMIHLIRQYSKSRESHLACALLNQVFRPTDTITIEYSYLAVLGSARSWRTLSAKTRRKLLRQTLQGSSSNSKRGAQYVLALLQLSQLYDSPSALLLHDRNLASELRSIAGEIMHGR